MTYVAYLTYLENQNEVKILLSYLQLQNDSDNNDTFERIKYITDDNGKVQFYTLSDVKAFLKTTTAKDFFHKHTSHLLPSRLTWLKNINYLNNATVDYKYIDFSKFKSINTYADLCHLSKKAYHNLLDDMNSYLQTLPNSVFKVVLTKGYDDNLYTFASDNIHSGNTTILASSSEFDNMFNAYLTPDVEMIIREMKDEIIQDLSLFAATQFLKLLIIPDLSYRKSDVDLGSK